MIDTLEIYRLVSGIEIKVASIASNNAILATGIMSKNEVSVTIATDTFPDIQEEDFIRIDEIKYKLNRAPEFTDNSAVNHSTSYLFEAPEYTLIDKILTNRITKSTKVTLTGKLRDWLELLVWNVNKTEENPEGVDTGWVLGLVPDTEYLVLTFDGIDCRSLLSELASAYDCEYYVHDHTINYIHRIENERNLIFTQGEGGGLYTIEQVNVDDGDVTTRIYPVGGTDNVTPGEGDEDGRLVLPERYLENFSEVARSVEKKVVFDKVHPTFIGKVENPTGENNREFVCSTIDFNVRELAVGDDARINFLTGDLMGKSFEFQWDNENKKITLIYKEDELAPMDKETQTRPLIPSATKYLRGGEEFNFTGILLGDSYKQAAITTLRTKAKEWLDFHCKKRVKFNLNVDHRYMRSKGELKSGDLITINLPERNINRLIRITSVEKNLKTDKISCVVSNYLSEKWEDKIEGQISSMQATINNGSGGNVTVIEKLDERPLTDKNVLSSLRSLLEITNLIRKKAISKEHDDQAEGIITFMRGLVSNDTVKAKLGAEFGNFVNSMIAGKGAGVDEHGNMQVESLEVRSYMKVMELIINRISAVESDFNFTESGTIDNVEELEPDTYLLTIRKRWDFDFTAFREHDIAYGSINTLLSDGSYFTSWFRVLSVDTSANTLTVATYPDNEVPAGKNFAPAPGMNISRRGNAVNEERQSCWYISSFEGCIMYLEGVTKPILDESNYYLSLGKPKHLELFNGLPINYKHPYIFARGAIIQDLLRIDFQGNPIYEIVDLGLWDAAMQYIRGKDSISGKYLQHQVWYRSCCWRCATDAATIGLPPRWNNTQWVCVVGDSNFTLEITSTKGRFFRFGQEYTTLSFVLKHGEMDVSVDAWQVEWTRESGLPEEDLLWNTEHAGNVETVDITPRDMPSNWYEVKKVAFRCTVFLRDGETVQSYSESFSINK